MARRQFRWSWQGRLGSADGIRGCGWEFVGGAGWSGLDMTAAYFCAERRADWNDFAAGDLREFVFWRKEEERLFMAASQSLYTVYVETQGAYYVKVATTTMVRIEQIMKKRMTIEIDRTLLREAMTVEEPKRFVKRGTCPEIAGQTEPQEGIRRFRGKVQWKGNPDEMRGG